MYEDLETEGPCGPGKCSQFLDPRGSIGGPYNAKKGIEGQDFFPIPALVTESLGEPGQRSAQAGGPTHLHFQEGKGVWGKELGWEPPELPAPGAMPHGKLPPDGPWLSPTWMAPTSPYG